ncbi:methyltransferase domain-containing protein [Roseobacter sp. HKCCD9010]|uniref:class I SAM-dependent methyltransferase n=1 Tax=unclassified Roseobacter TaxID=196798 RepID=UPI0014915E60|nr:MULTISPECIES: class I SAM-dependent methyltransferase [unclassified Roseobacter]MBF9050864.1 methyltransferase domain-containing protein [Rhodobacterales bacterium HKCCD4356]NNV12633.1 methyltransferase domain-containing protein [Roseobacter sp. HKCCD7357]NNV16577.1 methyltransferase domain-containing protein [Roseobacter sp. HKCCD8768]NNV26791.1 methyltransferase domain-containing protein [Roseobacter sp. HKCCD8192]NNV30296.1 methyltransferase domain-containing protein [Roseobacter sp. HKC
MSDQGTIDAYDARAASYAALDINDAQTESLRAFLACLPAGGTILDLGCGPGLQAKAMQDAGFAVIGLDATPAFVTAAQSVGIDARLGTFDDVTETEAYDGIWASFSLLHAPRADFPRHLTALAKALRPGGYLYLGMKLGTGEGRDALGRFYSYYSETELRTALEGLGLTVSDVTTGTGTGLAGTTDPFILITAHG